MSCKVEECDRPVKSREMCSMHLGRWYRHGTTDPARSLLAAPLVEAVARHGGLAACGIPKYSSARAAFYRGSRRGTFSLLTADDLAHRILGCHPADIWPEWWGVDGVEFECQGDAQTSPGVPTTSEEGDEMQDCTR